MSRLDFAVCLFVLLNILGGHYAQGEKYTVHLIPHSHCDPGWLQTYQQYYQGQVRNILTNVLHQLESNPKKTFVWAEISFFKLWWDEQPLAKKESLKRLVDAKQFEFIGGGWVQNDEATVHVDSVIDQITEGHEWLLKTFGVKPKYAWQIDPFGHSSLTPTLFSEIGYQALVINRIHYSLKESYKRNRNLEFIWRASPTLGKDAEMFTHILHTHYAAPIGFDYEEGNSYSLVNNAHAIPGQAESFARMVKDRATSYRTNQIMIPWGDDFKFQRADWQFQNMDLLIEHINSKSDQFGVEIKYSTLSTYFEAVGNYLSSHNDVKFNIYHSDFFPYADNEDSYWTGYYTTRPTLKAICRKAPSVIRSAEALYALARSAMHDEDHYNWDFAFDSLLRARQSNALVAHHDGVTGTSKPFVVTDYMSQLQGAMEDSYKIIAAMAEKLLIKATPPWFPDVENINPASITGYGQGIPNFQLTDTVLIPLVYHNALGWSRKYFATVTIDTPNIQILDSELNPISFQISPVWTFEHGGLKDDPEMDRFELHFLVELPPMGLRTYFLKQSATGSGRVSSPYVVYKSSVQRPSPTLKKVGSEDMYIESEFMRLDVGAKGFVSSITDKTHSKTIPVDLKYYVYQTSRSGAYIFRSDGGAAREYNPSNDPVPRVHIIKGKLLEEIQIIMDTTIIKARMYKTDDPELSKHIEITHTLASLRGNSEVVARYTTGIKTEEHTLFTDNGMELRQRFIDTNKKRESNYFPVQSTAILRDDRYQFTVLSRQVSGISSDTIGSLEIMMHRHMSQDDGRGLGEGVIDTSATSITHWILLDTVENSEKVRRKLSVMLEHPPKMVYASLGTSVEEWSKYYHTIYSPLDGTLPDHVHLLTLRSRDAFSDEVILRFMHLYESDSPISTYTKTTPVSISQLFSAFEIQNIRAVSISLNQEPNHLKPIYPVNITNLLPSLGKVPLEAFSGESQNSNEAGVFISQNSLELLKKKEKQNSEEEGVFISQDAVEKNGRKPLQMSDDVSIAMEPLDIKTLLIQVESKGTLHRAIVPKLEKPRAAKDDVEEDIAEGPDAKNINPEVGGRVGLMETRTMMIVSMIGIGLIFVIYMRLTARNKRRRKVSTL